MASIIPTQGKPRYQNSGRAEHRVGTEGKLIERMRLENSLTLEMFDHSRHVAGDRWLVSFEARVEVKVKPEYFMGGSKTGISLEDVRALLGEKTTYRYIKERNFIAETEREAVLEDLKERFLDTSLGYISSLEFPRKLVHRKYQEAHSETWLRPPSFPLCADEQQQEILPGKKQS
jgi:hypothetical protein